MLRMMYRNRSSFGQSNLDPSQIKGYNARNAPFGSEAAIGNEHLSALQETYLENLGAESGLDYARLTDFQNLGRVLRSPKLAVDKVVRTDVRWQPALLAFAAAKPCLYAQAISISPSHPALKNRHFLIYLLRTVHEPANPAINP